MTKTNGEGGKKHKKQYIRQKRIEKKKREILPKNEGGERKKRLQYCMGNRKLGKSICRRKMGEKQDGSLDT